MVVRGQANVIEEFKRDLSMRKSEIALILREEAALARLTFAAAGRLCSRCQGLSRVAVIAGRPVCSSCVIVEAERLALKGAGS